jgi:hypothetical protein
MDTERTSGGICKLREIIAEFPAETAYDFRERFHLSVFEIGKSVSWLEAVLLFAVIKRDTNSWTQAVMSEWKYPVSREWIVAAHTYDLHTAVNSKKKSKSTYPTPWPDSDTSRLGSRKINPMARDYLERMNPKE